MIYTVTLNPALDIVYQTGTLTLGGLNRAQSQEVVIGGKGINISVLLKHLGLENIALGFLGGFTGAYIEDELAKLGLETSFLKLSGTTRLNTKVNSQGQTATEVNAPGPEVGLEQQEAFLKDLKSRLQAQDTLALAGNAAPGISPSFYAAIARLCQEKDVHFALDTNRDLLKACLPYQPAIIKPNQEELGDLVGRTLVAAADVLGAAQEIQALGARNVLVSLGAAGALLLTETGEVYKSQAPQGRVVNPTGAGDSMLAGYLAAQAAGETADRVLQWATACGSATAFSVGIAERPLIEKCFAQTRIEPCSTHS